MNGSVLATSHHVSSGITALFALLLVGLILCLAMEEKLHAKKSIIAGVFAVFCLLLGGVCGILSFEPIVVGSHQIVVHDDLHGEMVLSDEGKKVKIDVPEPSTEARVGLSQTFIRVSLPLSPPL